MREQCPLCRESLQEAGGYTCERCGAELIDNGQLLDALTLWDVRKPVAWLPFAVPLGLVTASGLAAAALHATWLIAVGAAGAALWRLQRQRRPSRTGR